MSVPRVVIVGGGFSGLTTAIQLARHSSVPLHVTVLNAGWSAARGVAYSAAHSEHLLTLPVSVMCPFPDEEHHLRDWLLAHCKEPLVTECAGERDQISGLFLPRQLYGDYLEQLLQEYITAPVAQTPSPAKVSIQLVHAHALDVVGCEVHLDDGSQLGAEFVVLATGNEAPSFLCGDRALADHPAWCPNPWRDWSDKLPRDGGKEKDAQGQTSKEEEEEEIEAGAISQLSLQSPLEVCAEPAASLVGAVSGGSQDVVILGTGLTAVDAILTLLKHNFQGTIHAVSSHGLLPAEHFTRNEADHALSLVFPPPGVGLAALGLQELVQLVQAHCAQVRLNGGHPERLVELLGPHCGSIWRALSLPEKVEFMQKYSTQFRTQRQKIAPRAYVQIREALATGRLRITRGRVEGVSARGPALLHVEVAPKDAKSAKDGEGGGGGGGSGGASGTPSPTAPSRRLHLAGGLVINCLGPNARLTGTASPLLRSLLARGIIQPDDMDMGVRINVDDLSVRVVEDEKAAAAAAAAASSVPSSPSVVSSSSSSSSPRLFALGPLLRGELFDTVAVPNVRDQALRIAKTISAEAARARTATAAAAYPHDGLRI